MLAGLTTCFYLLCLHASDRDVHADRVHSVFEAEKEAPEYKAHKIKKSITVVVNFNLHNTVHVEVVHVLHTTYSVFHRVVFTGQPRPKGLDKVVKWSSCEFEWTFFDLCLAYTMLEYPEALDGGYIFIGDDAVRSFLCCLCLCFACITCQVPGHHDPQNTCDVLCPLQIMNPCLMITLNSSKFWTPPLRLVPNRREERTVNRWCESPL